MTERWNWGVKAYYTMDRFILESSRPGRRGAQPGDFAFETKHANEASADFEVAAAESRPEIGTVYKFRLNRTA